MSPPWTFVIIVVIAVDQLNFNSILSKICIYCVLFCVWNVQSITLTISTIDFINLMMYFIFWIFASCCFWCGHRPLVVLFIKLAWTSFNTVWMRHLCLRSYCGVLHDREESSSSSCLLWDIYFYIFLFVIFGVWLCCSWNLHRAIDTKHSRFHRIRLGIYFEDDLVVGACFGTSLDRQLKKKNSWYSHEYWMINSFPCILIQTHWMNNSL